MIHIVMGISGSGKTTASKYIAQKLDAEIINTDVLHSLLFPNGERTETGDFTPEQLAEIYRCLRPLAYYLSKTNPTKHIIFEGNFRFKSQLDFITEMMKAENLSYKILFIEIANDVIAEKRITNRHLNEGAPDTYEDYLKIKQVYEKPDDAYVIDNSEDTGSFETKLDDYIKSIS